MQQEDLKQLSLRIDNALCRDQFRLKKMLTKLRSQKEVNFDRIRSNLMEQLQKSEDIIKQRTASIPPISYPKALPIQAKREEIQTAIRNYQVVVISGETGSGKTTQIPKMCLEIGRGIKGRIACTQPRRIAATSLAEQVSRELNTEPGNQVGYRVRFADQTREETLVHFMTDGILLAEVQSDRFLNNYDTIIIDEAHERTLNIDFLLGYIKQLLPKRPDLKLIITSATIDVDRFSAAFPLVVSEGKSRGKLWNERPSRQPVETERSPVIEVSGRMYPVETRYAPIDELIEEQGEITMIDLVRDAVEEILTETRHGDILVFMSGFQEIKEVVDRMTDLEQEGFIVLPLYGRLTRAEQNRIFQQSDQRKIVISTNIAETSITIPGIGYVVDTGRARISQYNTRSGTKGLPVKLISQSSANQRKGRCGRLSNGICVRLYSEEDFLSRQDYTTPEIRRSDLAEVILRMSSMKLGDIATFPFIDPPESAQIRAGIRTLKELGAIDGKKRLTPTGREMASLPVDPRTARMILQAKDENVLYPVLIIASAISCMDPRERPEDKQTQADQLHAKFRSDESDLMSLLNLWEHYHTTLEELKTQGKMRKFCKKNFLSYNRIREWRDIHGQLSGLAKEKGWSLDKPDNWDYDAIHRSILSGYLSNIALKKEKRQYEGVKGREVYIFPGSGQKKGKHDWIVAIELIETSRLFAHRVARINPEWLETLAAHLCRKSWTEPWWDSKTGNVVAWEKVTLFGFTIIEKRRVNYGPVDRKAANTVFIREALVEEKLDISLPFLNHNRALIAEIRRMEDQQRKRNILVSTDKMEAFYQERISCVASVNDLKRLIKKNKGDKFLFMSRKNVIQQDPDTDVSLFPDYLLIGGRRCRLSYRFEPGDPEDGVTIELPWSLLNTVQASPFDYLVPGLLQEKITWLFKNLPKPLRRKIFPVQEVAQRVWDSMISTQYSTAQSDGESSVLQDFYHDLSEGLFKQTRVYIEPDKWGKDDLPDYLQMNYRVRHPKTKKIVQGRSLSALQADKTPGENQWDTLIRPFSRNGITRWDFGTLLEEIRLNQGEDVPICGFRALALQDKDIILTVCKSKEEAEDTSIIPVSVLIERELGEELSWLYQELRFPPETLNQFQHLWKQTSDIAINMLQKKLGAKPGKLQKGFHSELQQKVYSMAVAGLTGVSDEPVLTEKAYRKRVDTARNELNGLGSRLVNWIRETMTAYQTLCLELIHHNPDNSNPAIQTIADEVDFFFNDSCLSDIPFTQWRHTTRLFRSYLRRIEKTVADPLSESMKSGIIAPYQDHCIELWRHRKSLGQKRLWLLKKYRWMLEEFKVSVFSQDLKTAFPISEKRLDRFLRDHLE